MKKLITILAISMMGFISCSKNNDVNNLVNTEWHSNGAKDVAIYFDLNDATVIITHDGLQPMILSLNYTVNEQIVIFTPKVDGGFLYRLELSNGKFYNQTLDELITEVKKK